MEMAGTGKPDRDVLPGYLALTPPLHRGDVLKDRRAYIRPDVQPEVRGVEIWREARRALL
eukprot:5962748-Lingulodinium_polyedra.AAC.1